MASRISYCLGDLLKRLFRDQRKYQNSASLAFVNGINWWPMNSPHKVLVMRKRFNLMTSCREMCNEIIKKQNYRTVCVNRCTERVIAQDSTKFINLSNLSCFRKGHMFFRRRYTYEFQEISHLLSRIEDQNKISFPKSTSHMMVVI